MGSQRYTLRPLGDELVDDTLAAMEAARVGTAGVRGPGSGWPGPGPGTGS
jgi:hypothetical protein